LESQERPQKSQYYTKHLNSAYSKYDTAEPLVPDPSPLRVEIAIAKLKRYKLPGTIGIPVELIQAGGD
jgi:hypothetical protein